MSADTDAELYLLIMRGDLYLLLGVSAVCFCKFFLLAEKSLSIYWKALTYLGALMGAVTAPASFFFLHFLIWSNFYVFTTLMTALEL